MVLVPGFEPGSPPRKGGMMDRTTPHERQYCETTALDNRFVSNIIKFHKSDEILVHQGFNNE